MTRFRLTLLPLCLLLAACGSSSSSSSSSSASPPKTTPKPKAAAPTSTAADIGAAAHPSARDFPAARGRSLNALVRGITPVGDVGQATGTYVPGTQRFGFVLLDKHKRFVYGPTAVYIAKNPNAPARGPFLAPADSLAVAPRFRSKAAAEGGAPTAVLATKVPIPKAGTYSVLTLTKVGGRLLGGASQIAARAGTPIPGVGDRAPVIDTPTLASAGGRIADVTTRIPPDDMHAVSFKHVVGRRPVALLFSTPALCQSRVCAPVTDALVALEPKFKDRITFIHQEVYAQNNPAKGYRPQMKAFHLQTEPWLFTIDRRGRVAARLEGTFGRNEIIAALKAAMR
jgi:hypothetical protein